MERGSRVGQMEITILNNSKRLVEESVTAADMKCIRKVYNIWSISRI